MVKVQNQAKSLRNSFYAHVNDGHQLSKVEACSRHDGVDSIAFCTQKIVSPEPVIVLHMPNHGFNAGSAFNVHWWVLCFASNIRLRSSQQSIKAFVPLIQIDFIRPDGCEGWTRSESLVFVAGVGGAGPVKIDGFGFISNHQKNQAFCAKAGRKFR